MIIKAMLKLLLIPVWLILFAMWIPIHAAVFICGMFHGLGKLVFGSLAVLAIVFGMWQNAALFSIVILLTFLVVLAGVIIDTALEVSYRSLGRIILS